MNWMRVDTEGNVEQVDVVEDLGEEVVIQVKGRGDTFLKKKFAKQGANKCYCKDNQEVAAWNKLCKERRIVALQERILGLREKLAAAEHELEDLTGTPKMVDRIPVTETGNAQS